MLAMRVLSCNSLEYLVKGSVSSLVHSRLSFRWIRSFHRTFLKNGRPFITNTNSLTKSTSISPNHPSTFGIQLFRSFSTEYPGLDKDPVEAVDDFLEALEGKNNSWWSLYVRGKVPDYPPRREMYEKLTEEGIDVELMEAFEVEDFTRWLLMRKKYGPNYPKMPYNVTLEQKIEELKKRIPLSRCDDIIKENNH
ncbi:hypothetical protein BgAZ_110660 [Babesia gibsoni]|uniref:Uncharacterized protein n=1 Tax=Babesia gibsoni TaxID=33632 RepID=A0AAD8PH52_BABGI|nr:hypothetical protein BgAZ_110660 [Babesia gibsoni]